MRPRRFSAVWSKACPLPWPGWRSTYDNPSNRCNSAKLPRWHYHLLPFQDQLGKIIWIRKKSCQFFGSFFPHNFENLKKNGARKCFRSLSSVENYVLRILPSARWFRVLGTRGRRKQRKEIAWILHTWCSAVKSLRRGTRASAVKIDIPRKESSITLALIFLVVLYQYGFYTTPKVTKLPWT